MALTARAINVPTGPNVSSAHMPSGGRNVASIAFSPVEELSPKAEVFSDPNFSFQGFTEWMASRRPQTPDVPANTVSNFTTPSTTFLHLLSEQQHQADPSALGGGKDTGGRQMMLKKAIHSYEGIADVIANKPPHLGANLSFAS